MVVFKAFAAHKTEGNINTKCAWCEKRHVYRRHVWWSLVPEYERCRYTWTSLNQIQLRLCERVPFLSFTQPLHTSALRLIWDTWQVVVSFLSSFHFTSFMFEACVQLLESTGRCEPLKGCCWGQMGLKMKRMKCPESLHADPLPLCCSILCVQCCSSHLRGT